MSINEYRKRKMQSSDADSGKSIVTTPPKSGATDRLASRTATAARFELDENELQLLSAAARLSKSPEEKETGLFDIQFLTL